MTTRTRSKHDEATLRLIVLVTALIVALAGGRSAKAAPAPVDVEGHDIHSVAPEASSFQLGQSGVAENLGAATYSFPIRVPPGRRGMEPRLALTYSSRSPLRGGLAAGWTLELPSIRRDTSHGTLAEIRYRASVAGHSGVLVEVDDLASEGGTTYRMKLDDGFIRFERTANGWIARSPDGMTYRLGTRETSTDGAGYWLLDSEVDSVGNAVTYEWRNLRDAQGRPLDAALETVAYTSHPDQGVEAHARVNFAYAAESHTCGRSNVPVGASLSLRNGVTHMAGAHQLESISTQVRDFPGAAWRTVETVALGYDERELSCTESSGAPLRMLQQIDRTAFAPDGAVTALPPVTFAYGAWSPGGADAGEPDAPHPGPVHAGTVKRLETTLLNVNADGVPDLVSVAPKNGSCKLLVRFGREGGGYASGDPTEIPLPTLPWPNGGTGPTADPNDLEINSCSLMGQVTSYRNVESEHACLANTGTLLAYRFVDVDGDGDDDLINAIHSDEVVFDPECELAWESKPGRPDDCIEKTLLEQLESGVDPEPGTLFSTFSFADSDPLQTTALRIDDPRGGDLFQEPIDPCLGPNGCSDPPPEPGPTPNDCGNERVAQQRATGSYVWRVYVNDTPDGASRSFVKPLSNPNYAVTSFPLPSTTHEMASLPDPVGVSSATAMLDFDGNGVLDLVADKGDAWSVSRYDHGEFHTSTTEWSAPHSSMLPAPHPSASTISESVPRLAWGGYGGIMTGTKGLTDVNGDGLPDAIVRNSIGLYAFLSHGRGFLPTVTPLLLGSDHGIFQKDDRNERRYHYYQTDVDGDGLVDLLDLRTDPPEYYPNVGDTFLEPARPLPVEWKAAERLITIVGGHERDGSAWELANDFRDLDGDGFAELLDRTSGNPTLRRLRGDDPPRLLAEVEEHDGSAVRFEYEPVTASDLGRGVFAFSHKLPHVFQVVSSITVEDESSPASKTSYGYTGPVYATETGSRFDARTFLGFESIEKISPLGGRTERDFVFAGNGDQRARLVRETTYDERGAVTYREVAPWAQEKLFEGKVTFSHPTSETTRTCMRASGLPYLLRDVCAQQNEAALHTTSFWTVHPDQGQPVLYLRTNRLQRPGSGSGIDDRNTLTTHRVDYGEDTYRVLTTESRLQGREEVSVADIYADFLRELGYWEEYEELLADLMTIQAVDVSITRTDHDERGLPIADHIWIEGDTYAITRRDYDPFGNLASVTKPEQVAAGAVGTTFVYDAHGVHVGETTNPLGHTVRTVYDPGTGALLEREGPNQGQLELQETDGLGRVTKRRITVGNLAESSTEEVETIAYDDLSIPQSVVRSQLVDFRDNWGTTTSFYDGRGRLIKTEDPVEAVSRYYYDETGQLEQVDTPDPRTDDGTLVSTTFARDRLGRLLSLTQPDGSRVELAHDGLTTRIESYDPNGGHVGTKWEDRDMLGRLVGVEQEIDSETTALTTYFYDATDTVVEIEDADGNVTRMEHDGAGRRRAILRGERTLRYDYDLNGNLVARTTPVPAGGFDADFTSLFEHDALDRVTREDPATRGRSADERERLGIGPIRYFYDEADQKLGRLSHVTLPHGSVVYQYDVRGNVTYERSLAVTNDPPVSAQNKLYREFGPQDQPVWIKERGIPWTVRYDARGMPSVIRWLDLKVRKWKEVANFERSDAGQIRSQTSDYGQTRAFIYDVAGRVVFDEVKAGGVIRAWREYGFLLDGHLGNVWGETGGAVADAGFSYDRLGRILTANGPAGYTAELTYSAAGNVDHSVIGWATQAVRDVEHAYGQVDAQAVDALLDPFGGEHASFGYDAAGNMVGRTIGDAHWSFKFDGADQMREVVDDQGRSEVYRYDHTGRRARAIRSDGVRVWLGGSELHYDAAGKFTKRRIRIGGQGGVSARVDDSTELELHYSDAVRNLLVALDRDGNATATFLYGAFGEVVHQEGGGDHRRRFNGKEDDERSGLRYYGVRYYDPVALRWNAGDPLYRFVPEDAQGDPQRMNLYAFSLNNPLRYFDPDGRKPQPRFGVEIGPAEILTAEMVLQEQLAEAKQRVRQIKRKIRWEKREKKKRARADRASRRKRQSVYTELDLSEMKGAELRYFRKQQAREKRREERRKRRREARKKKKAEKDSSDQGTGGTSGTKNRVPRPADGTSQVHDPDPPCDIACRDERREPWTREPFGPPPVFNQY